MSKPVVFVSYSHRDEVEKEQLVSHLKVLERAGVIELWVDDRIAGGADWAQEIKQAIARANVAILLISANFLTSDFILGEEVPAFLQRRQSEGLTVFPVIARACAWDSFDWLAQMNVRPKNARPIWSGTSGQIDEDLSAIAKEVATAAKKGKVRQNPPPTPSGVIEPLSETADDPDREQAQKLLATKIRRLHALQQQEALYGISTPPEIRIEIEDLETEITELKKQLS
ncbi:MAG: toll/interleukin-1 receptor domain-containing protein [Anaerolineae bacterium]|nr:toll/interleukin-1 receptor domain-containing protein [Anaerolineae bacterium]